MRPLRTLSHRTQDALLALAILTGGILELATSGAPAHAYLFPVAIAAPLAFRRRATLPALTMAYGAAIASFFLIEDIEDFTVPFITLLLGSYTAGWLPRLRDALVGLAMGWCIVAAIYAINEPRVLGDLVFPGGFAFFAWGVGRAVRQRTLLAAELHEAALRAEEQHEQDAARAVAEERRRIAREMHDLVGHSVSVMVVQAGGARRILDRDPDRAIEAAIRIEQTGRAALAEMRRLLGLMGPSETGQFAPQPSLAGLGALVQRARDAGLPANLRIDGEPRELPAGAELAAYRVVQEALTNAIKHAGRAPTEVVVRWDPEALELVVSDSGRGATPPADGGGHGLVGMRERVRVYGGELTALPRPDGGFVVRARIPLRQDEVQAA
jgi:signal transduction histidine kinase